MIHLQPSFKLKSREKVLKFLRNYFSRLIVRWVVVCTWIATRRDRVIVRVIISFAVGNIHHIWIEVASKSYWWRQLTTAWRTGRFRWLHVNVTTFSTFAAPKLTHLLSSIPHQRLVFADSHLFSCNWKMFPGSIKVFFELLDVSFECLASIKKLGSLSNDLKK